MAPSHNNSQLSDRRLPNDLYGRPDCRRKHDPGSYIWLAYSIFFFIEPILRHSASYWRHQLPLYAIFLALYIGYVHFEARIPRLAVITGIFLLGVITIPSNSGGSSFFIYVAALLPFCVESQAALLAVMLLEIATLALENHFFPGNPFNYLLTGFFALVVGGSNLFIAQEKRADRKLRLAQEENVALAALAERERIARDLHDVLGHTLSVIVLKAELAGRLLATTSDTERAAREIADVERTARTALAEVREAIGGYRAKGLAAELEQARNTLASAGVALSCETPIPRLAAAEETVLSLALREAVTNIVRHAHAKHCRVAFSTTPDNFRCLQIQDDGVGFSSTSSTLQGGHGLRGMRERVEAAGGRFSVLGVLNPHGTCLTIELPVSTAALPSPEPARLVEV